MEDKQDKLSCGNCKKPFPQESSLLRHISHAILCKKHYGEERINQLRMKARLMSKQKYNKKESTKKSDAKRYQRDKVKKNNAAKEKNKQRFVRMNGRDRDFKLFHKFYLFIFDDLQEDMITEKLVLTGICQEDIDKSIEEKALDQTIETDDWVHFYEKRIEEVSSENLNEEVLIEKAFEDSYEVHQEKQYKIHMDNWGYQKSESIFEGCFWRGKQQAMDFYKEFLSSTLLDIKANAMKEAREKMDGFVETVRFGSKITYDRHLSEVLARTLNEYQDDSSKLFNPFKDSDIVKKIQIAVRNLIEKHIAKFCIHY